MVFVVVKATVTSVEVWRMHATKRASVEISFCKRANMYGRERTGVASRTLLTAGWRSGDRALGRAGGRAGEQATREAEQPWTSWPAVRSRAESNSNMASESRKKVPERSFVNGTDGRRDACIGRRCLVPYAEISDSTI